MVFSSKHFLFRCHLDKLTHVHQKQLPTREMQGHCALQHTKVNLLLISINDGFEIPKHIMGNQEWGLCFYYGYLDPNRSYWYVKCLSAFYCPIISKSEGHVHCAHPVLISNLEWK